MQGCEILQSACLCLSVCLSVYSRIAKLHVQTLRNVLNTRPVALVQSFSNDIAMRHAQVLFGFKDDIPFTHNDHTRTHPFNGRLSGTTRVSRYQKGKTNLDFTEARDS